MDQIIILLLRTIILEGWHTWSINNRAVVFFCVNIALIVLLQQVIVQQIDLIVIVVKRIPTAIVVTICSVAVDVGTPHQPRSAVVVHRIVLLLMEVLELDVFTLVLLLME